MIKKYVLFHFLFLIPSLSWSSVKVGSKNFTESFVLAELLSQTIELSSTEKVERLFGLGGTAITYESLKSRKIDLYIEYTGTINEAILKNSNIKSEEKLKSGLAEYGIVLGPEVGFNNTYALAIQKEFSEKNSITKISDLKNVLNKSRFAFSYEFMARNDGFSALTKHYGLDIRSENVIRMDHTLVYTALKDNKVDVIEVYSTDAQIDKMNLVVLDDDQKFFPPYKAVILANNEFVNEFPEVWKMLSSLKNKVNDAQMRKLNAAVDLDGQSFQATVAEFLNQKIQSYDSISKQVWQRTKEHLLLVLMALIFSMILGIPLGIVAQKKKRLGQFLLAAVGLAQTIPSLALLCFFIPIFGIGPKAAIIALIVYGLLPIVLNVYEGLDQIDSRLKESASSLDLSKFYQLFKVELPLASPTILVGIKTSAIISVGTATLAAFIGAGGYGAPIASGLAINDQSLILMGAIPSALMAIIIHFAFDFFKVIVIPKGLRL